MSRPIRTEFAHALCHVTSAWGICFKDAAKPFWWTGKLGVRSRYEAKPPIYFPTMSRLIRTEFAHALCHVTSAWGICFKDAAKPFWWTATSICWN